MFPCNPIPDTIRQCQNAHHCPVAHSGNSDPSSNSIRQRSWLLAAASSCSAPKLVSPFGDRDGSIRPVHNQMPELLYVEDHEQWLHGSLGDIVALQDRSFPDDLITMERTADLWAKHKATSSASA